MFFALGLGMGLWGGASGGILARAGIDAASFGVMLTVYTGAYLIAMSSGGALARRVGVEAHAGRKRRPARPGDLRPSRHETGCPVASCLVLSGFLAGMVDVTMNAENPGSNGLSDGRFWRGSTRPLPPGWLPARSSAASSFQARRPGPPVFSRLSCLPLPLSATIAPRVRRATLR